MSDADADPPRHPLLKVVRPLVFAGWTIAVVRLLLDAAAPESAKWFGLYWALPAVLLVLALRGAFEDLGWRRLALAMLLTACLVWAPMNAIAYTTAQFAGWTHGRFDAEHAPQTAETAPRKVVFGVVTGLATIVPGTVWMTAAATLLVWLPRRLRRGAPPRADTPPFSDGA